MKPQIPWLRVFVEGVVIVGSILLAFGIDAAWSERQERAEEQEILVGLQREFLENQEILRGSLALVDEGVVNLRSFIALTPDEAAQLPSESAWERVITPHRRVFSSNLALGFLDATVSSGKLALVRDSNLRAALARTEGLQADVLEVLDYAQDLSLEAARLLGRYPEIQTVVSRVNPDGSGEISPSTLRALRADEELLEVSTAKAGFWAAYSSESQRLAEHVTLVLSMIEAALE